MKNLGHWSKFSEAIRSMHAATPEPRFVDLYRGSAALMSSAQRFYLPDSRNVLVGKVYDDPVKDLIRLPYEVILLLSECDYSDSPVGDMSSWKITLAFDPRGPSNARENVISPSVCSDRGIVTLSLMPTLSSKISWALMPIAVVIDMVDGQPGIRQTAHGDPEFFAEFQRSHKVLGDGGEFDSDITSVTNLCAILNLANVTAQKVAAPSALNKKRAKTGKLPLYDYHVLEVDGERWDSPYETSGSGEGVRSHLRRGHIRRLPEKSVWVRATFVHGSVPGFVDKDYKL